VEFENKMAVRDLERKVPSPKGNKRLKRYWQFKQKIVKLNADLKVEETFLKIPQKSPGQKEP